VIVLDRELDEAEFVRCLGLRYVIVSGYVAILLGRARSTDDIDIIVEAVSGSEIAARVGKCGFKPLSLSASLDEEFRDASVRFYKPPQILPNFEVKPPRSFYQRYALENRVEAHVGGAVFYVSPLELQIVYKLWLGSDKDLEDAVYLYRFGKIKGLLSEELLKAWARRMKVSLRSLKESGDGTYITT